MASKILDKKYRAMRENRSVYRMTELNAIIKHVVRTENQFNALTFVSGNYKVQYKLIGTNLFVTISVYDKVYFQVAQLRYTDLSHLHAKHTRNGTFIKE